MPSRSLGDAWWRHQLETFSELLILCTGNSPVTGDFPAQRPVTRNFDIFFDLHLNKPLSNLRPHRAHYDVTVMARMWRLSLFSSFTPYNITFPFGTFINTCMLCNTYWYWCLQLHVEGVIICLHFTHVYFHNTLTSSTYIQHVLLYAINHVKSTAVPIGLQYTGVANRFLESWIYWERKYITSVLW